MPRHLTPAGRGLGWRRQQLDNRDHVYAAPAHVAANLPDFVDLRQYMPPVYDQGQLGSCVANAVACLLQYERKRQGIPEGDRVPSRLQIYYGARRMEGTVHSDAGSQIRDAVKWVSKHGAAFEDGPDGWPYDPAKVFTQPPDDLDAYRDKRVAYRQVPQTAQGIMSSLAEGWPVAFGFTVYDELDGPEVAKNDASDPLSGRLPMPRQGEAPLGGHAVVIVGYDNGPRTFLIRNSWGDAWGLRGMYLMDYEYVLRSDLSSDFWQIRVE